MRVTRRIGRRRVIPRRPGVSFDDLVGGGLRKPKEAVEGSGVVGGRVDKLSDVLARFQRIGERATKDESSHPIDEPRVERRSR